MLKKTDIKIIQKISAHNTSICYGRDKRYIVIHYTAGVTSRTGSAVNTAAYFAGMAKGASADFIVDDTDIVQYNPDLDNRYCWHCGDRKNPYSKGGSFYGTIKNSNSIGIEVCSSNSTGRITNANDGYWSFTDAALDRAVELTRYLMEKYNISAENVVRHYDVSGKLCPGIIGWNTDSGDESKWLAFKARLAEPENNEEDDDMDVNRFRELWLEMRKELQDNDASAYSEDARKWAVDSGLIQGGSSDEFNGMWEDLMTREQLVTVLYRFAQMVGKV